MTRFAPLLVFLLLLSATLVVGVVQGRMTDRWGVRPDARHAADQLRPELPAECGSWKMREPPLTLQPEVIKILQNPAYLNRVYVHQQTGDEVKIFVLVGHPGPVSVHTPEVCYSSRDYTMSGDRQRASVKLSTGDTHEFWELPLKPNGSVRGDAIRVFYGWSTGAKWEAAEHPRFGYGGLPHLYKLQMSVHTSPGSKAKGFDPGQDFLASFLVQLQPRMVEAVRRGGSSP
jgi:hypothetical protein